MTSSTTIDDTHSTTSISSNNIVELSPPLKKAKERRFRIVPILRQDICSVELPLEEYFVLSVADPRSIGSILRLLPTMPDSANHLKRIKDGRILIQPSSIALDHVLLNSIRDLLQEEPIIDRVQVPAKKPCTRRQFEWAKQRWPTAFHPNKEAESLLSGTFFNTSEQEKIIDFYRKAEKRKVEYAQDHSVMQ